MNSELRDELLYAIQYARGATTKELWLDINASRVNGLWKHQEPADEAALRLMLMGLSAEGQIENVAGTGWMLVSAVPRDTERRTFEEQVQQGLFT